MRGNFAAWAVSAIVFFIAVNGNYVLSTRYGIGIAQPVVFVSSVGLAMLFMIRFGDSPAGAARYFLAMTIWLIAVLLSIMFSATPESSLQALRDFAPIPMISFAVFFLVNDRERFLGVAWALALAAFLLSCLTVFQKLSGTTTNDYFGLARGVVAQISGDSEGFRPSGTIENPNYYAQMLLPGLAISLGSAMGERRLWQRIAFAIASSVIAAAVLMTLSRGGAVAMVATILVVMAYSRKVYLVAFLAPPALAILLLTPGKLERFEDAATAVADAVTGQQISEVSVSGRISEMKVAAIAFSESPWTGVGFGQIELNYQAISARSDLNLRSSDRAAHSLYLEVAAEQGLPGLIALFAVIWLGFDAAKRRDHLDDRLELHRSMVVAGTAGMLIAAVFLHDAYFNLMWLMLTLLYAFERVAAVEQPWSAAFRSDVRYV